AISRCPRTTRTRNRRSPASCRWSKELVSPGTLLGLPLSNVRPSPGCHANGALTTRLLQRWPRGSTSQSGLLRRLADRSIGRRREPRGPDPEARVAVLAVGPWRLGPPGADDLANA